MARLEFDPPKMTPAWESAIDRWMRSMTAAGYKVSWIPLPPLPPDPEPDPDLLEWAERIAATHPQLRVWGRSSGTGTEVWRCDGCRRTRTDVMAFGYVDCGSSERPVWQRDVSRERRF